ncbi:MAG: HD domain-containing protein [Candidatus Dadabacteria bacterium]|nr:MAG: HD domain-containing protein [Candidatus Dadabacteria bacterium]
MTEQLNLHSQPTVLQSSPITLPPRPTEKRDLLISVIRSLRENTELRESMKNTLRWERFFLEDSVDLTEDMQGLGHAINTYRTTVRATEKEYIEGLFDTEQVAELRIAAIIHDIGEIGVGDITYSLKNATHESMEKEYFKSHIERLFPDLSDAQRKDLLRIYLDIAQGDREKDPQARYFSMIERIGYLETAVDLFRKKPSDIDWRNIVGNVLFNQGKHFDYLVDDYRAAREAIRSMKEDIEKMLKFVERNMEHLEDSPDVGLWRSILEKCP